MQKRRKMKGDKARHFLRYFLFCLEYESGKMGAHNETMMMSVGFFKNSSKAEGVLSESVSVLNVFVGEMKLNYYFSQMRLESSCEVTK